MMTNDDYQHFVCIAVGENPETLMGEYDKNKKVEPYVVYKYKDAAKLKEKYVEYYEAILNNKDASKSFEEDTLRETIDELKAMDDIDFYSDLTEGYTLDAKTGDALSTENPNGKWSSYQIGKVFSIPFLTKDGREVFQAKKSDIDWPKIHLAGKDIYERAWDMVMEGSEPTNDYETQIYENMKDKTAYFQKFETKENYIISNTAFWGYAFVSEKTGWIEASETDDQFTWMSNFYDLFIKNLDEDSLLTIYECRK